MNFKFRGTVLGRVCDYCGGNGIETEFFRTCIHCHGDGYILTQAGQELEAFIELIKKKYMKG